MGLQAMHKMTTLTLPLFPLGTILFPGGLLPLKLFEQRYLEMGKACLRDELPFGVCGIRRGTEVGAPATPFEVGCIAKIIHWDMPQLGILHITAHGAERFRVLSHHTQADGLLIGEVEPIATDPPQAIEPEFFGCAEVLKAIVQGVGEQHFHAPLQFDDATWVSNRLAEVLPLPLAEKQPLLELCDTSARLMRLTKILSQQGLVAQRGSEN
jgi:uncharacterized protein